MAEIKNVVLIGAGGNLGPSILAEFIKSDLSVTVFTREDSKSTFPSEVKVVRTDYSPESLAKAFKGQDAVVSIVGNAGFADQTKIIDAAASAGVKRFIPSEFGSDTANEHVRAIVPAFNHKKQVIDYLKTKESGDFSWTALITGPFFDWGLQVGFLGFNLQDKTATIWDGGNTPVTVTNLSTIGLALVKTLSSSSAFQATANQYVYVGSHTVSQNEILDGFQKLTGNAWSVAQEKHTKEVVPVELEKVKRGDYSGITNLILAAAYGDAAYGDFRKVPGGLWNDELGLPKEDLDTSLKAVL